MSKGKNIEQDIFSAFTVLYFNLHKNKEFLSLRVSFQNNTMTEKETADLFQSLEERNIAFKDIITFFPLAIHAGDRYDSKIFISIDKPEIHSNTNAARPVYKTTIKSTILLSVEDLKSHHAVKDIPLFRYLKSNSSENSEDKKSSTTDSTQRIKTGLMKATTTTVPHQPVVAGKKQPALSSISDQQNKVSSSTSQTATAKPSSKEKSAPMETPSSSQTQENLQINKKKKKKKKKNKQPIAQNPPPQEDIHHHDQSSSFGAFQKR